MAKNLEKILESFGIENVEETLAKLTGDEENVELVEQLLKSAQTYSTPFIKDSLKGEFESQKEALKGQYFKDASRQYFKRYPGLITNKELDELFKEGGFEAVVEAIDEKRDKPSGDESEAKQLLATANSKIEDLQAEVEKVAKEANERADSTINGFKTNNKVVATVRSLLKDKTNKDASKQADLFMKVMNGERAVFELNGSDEVEIRDPKNPDTALKNGDTKFMTLENLVDSFVEEYELAPAAPPQTPPDTKIGGDYEQDDKIQSSTDHIRSMLAKKKQE